jgi:hypothetical protein
LQQQNEDMPSLTWSRDSKNDNIYSPLVSTILIVLLLFFIDEGYYSFQWMFDWANWIAFVLYLIIIFPSQWLISRFLLSSLHGIKKTWVLIFTGIPITLLIAFLILK